MSPLGTLDMIITGSRWVLAALGAGVVTGAIANRFARTCSAVVGALSVMWIWCLVAWGGLDFFYPSFIFSTTALMIVAAVGGASLVNTLLNRRAKVLA
jgi:hypothetical protein